MHCEQDLGKARISMKRQAAIRALTITRFGPMPELITKSERNLFKRHKMKDKNILYKNKSHEGCKKDWMGL